MKIHRLWHDSDHQSINPTDEDLTECRNFMASTQQVLPRWPGLRARMLAQEDEGTPVRPYGDAPYCLGIRPAVSEAACAALDSLIGEYCEYLPITIVGDRSAPKYCLLHVLPELDALDLQRSDIDVFEGRVNGVDRYSFIEAAIGDHPIFRMPHHPRHAVFLTAPVVQQARRCGLTGFKFPVLWES